MITATKWQLFDEIDSLQLEDDPHFRTVSAQGMRIKDQRHIQFSVGGQSEIKKPAWRALLYIFKRSDDVLQPPLGAQFIEKPTGFLKAYPVVNIVDPDLVCLWQKDRKRCAGFCLTYWHDHHLGILGN